MSIHANRIEITKFFDGDTIVDIIVNNEKFCSLARVHKEPMKIVSAKRHAKRLKRSLKFPIYLGTDENDELPNLILE